MTSVIITGIINVVGFCVGFWIMLILVERYAKREVEMQVAKVRGEIDGVLVKLKAKNRDIKLIGDRLDKISNDVLGKVNRLQLELNNIKSEKDIKRWVNYCLKITNESDKKVDKVNDNIKTIMSLYENIRGGMQKHKDETQRTLIAFRTMINEEVEK